MKKIITFGILCIIFGYGMVSFYPEIENQREERVLIEENRILQLRSYDFIEDEEEDKRQQAASMNTLQIVTTQEIPSQSTQDTQEVPGQEETDIYPIETEKAQETPENEDKNEEKESKHYLDVPLSYELQDYIRSTCEECNVPFELAMAVIETESTYNPAAIGPDGHDYGLMQIRDVNHEALKEKYGVSDFMDPRQNSYCGIQMISEYLDKYGEIHPALMAYNAGEPGAKKLWKQGVYSTKYSRKVVSIYERLKGEAS